MKFALLAASMSLAVPTFGQYAGPAILSRGEAPAAMSVPKIRFQPFVEFTAMYDTGLANVGVNDRGQLANGSSAGVGLAWGVSGTHSWKRDMLGLSYRGSVTHYLAETLYDGFDHSLLLSYTHQFSRHISMNLRESAGMMTRNFGLLNMPQTVSFDPATAFIPVTDFFDNRTYYVNSHGDLNIQRSLRTSYSFSGDAFITRRRSSALTGDSGYMARGDMQYRLTRRTTVGGNYTYLHYSYTRFSGGTDVHGASGTYAIRLSRWMEFSGFAGFMRAESKSIQTTAVDPAIAALLGITSTSQIVHSIRYIPNFSGRFSRTFHTGVAYIAGGRTMTPGNGLFNTSVGTSVMAGYSYTGLRRWSIGANANYMWADSDGLISGRYNGYSAGLSMARQLVRGVHFTSSMSVRKYGSPDYSNYNRTIYDARVGFAYTPGELPLRIW